ncbi:MAG: ferrous iron transport protein B [Ignavibacteria bacterium]
MRKSDLNIERITKVISIIGPPNSGKTSIFNHLSGQKYKTVNYPGATVEFSVSSFLKTYRFDALLIDSPGIITLVPASPDEKVTVNCLFSHPKFGTPDLVIVTIDASQLSRHLLLIEQLKDSGFHIVVALTMMDILYQKGFEIDLKKLEELLDLPVVRVNGRSGDGINNLVNLVKNIINSTRVQTVKKLVRRNYSPSEIIEIFNHIEEIESQVIRKKNSINLDSANLQLKVLSNGRINKPDGRTIKMDRYFLHPIFGLLIFIVVMSLFFTSIFWLAAPIMDFIDYLFTSLSETIRLSLGETMLADLLANGVVTGTGAVMVFLPQIFILFVLLGFLEDTGYLARGAVLVDKPLSKIGLNGRSFVPMLSGFACAIPAIMATRTIPNKRERFLTMFIIPLMSCSAKLPVYSLLLSFLFIDRPFYSGISLAAIYLFSIVSSIIVAAIVNKFNDKIIKVNDNSSFIMELPPYRMPKLKFVIVHALKNSFQYLKKAGPIILVFSLLMWFLTNFPIYKTDTVKSPEQMKAEQITNSYAAQLGRFIEPAMRPMGMDWRVGVSLISTIAQREVFVSNLALMLKISQSDENMQLSILNAMREAKIESSGAPLFTPATIVGLIVFFVFALQCISTIAVIRKETNTWYLPLIQVIVLTTLAYLMSVIAVNLLRYIGVP